jgi:acetoin utilization deacetylase AcuC-like enzyme
VKIAYSDRYLIDIGAHVFPTVKYRLVRDAVVSSRLVAPDDILEPAEASWETLALVHAPEYLEKTRSGGFRQSELAQLELPWTPEAAEGFRVMTGGTVLAARIAVDDGARNRRRQPVLEDAWRAPLAVSANIGGGFHHAFPSHGEGFCLYNDIAVAIRALQGDGTIVRAAVVDCDLHQGNGTAFIFDGDRSVFTFSMHQERNYPFVKPRSSLDMGLTDGAGDEEYVRMLESAMPLVMASQPDLIVYVAGADPFIEDQLGGLNVTMDGLAERDRVMFEAARAARVPVAVVLAGGYARRVEDTAAIHTATIAAAVALAPSA